MPEDKDGIPFIGHNVAFEILECAYGIIPSDDDPYHERIEEKLDEEDIGIDGAIDLIERLMPMICHGKSELSGNSYKGFGKLTVEGDTIKHLEMIGKVPDEFHLTENENGEICKVVFKKKEG